MEGAGNLREVMDESPVEVHEPYEGLDILGLHWLWPVCDSLDLNRVHHYMVLRDNKPKVVHLSMFELAFLWCRWGETQSHAPNQPNQIHTTPDTELRRSRTKKTKADLLYLVQQATDTSSIFSNQTFQPVT